MFSISFEEYKNSLQKTLEERDSGRPPEEKIKKQTELVSSATQSWLRSSKDTQFNEKVEKSLQEIVQLKPGRKLIKKLLDDHKEFYIEKGPSPKYDRRKHAAYVNPQIEKTGYFLHHQVKNKIKFTIEDQKVFTLTLAHEMIHATHKEHLLELFLSHTVDLLNPLFDNLEEQIVITGLDDAYNTAKKVAPYCENVFRLAWGLNLRINHSSYTPKPKEAYTLADFVKIYHRIEKSDTREKSEKILMNFQKKIEKIQQALDTEAFFEALYEALDEAVYYGQLDLVNLLFDAGVKVDLEILKKAYREENRPIFDKLIQGAKREDLIKFLEESNGDDKCRWVFQHFPEDEEFFLITVSKNGLLLKEGADAIKNNEKIVIAAVTNNGSALQYASEQMKANRAVVLAAACNKIGALAYAAPELQKGEIRRLAIMHSLKKSKISREESRQQSIK